MNASPLAYLFIKLETYEKLKSLNRNENFTSMNENDLIMYMLDKLSEEINLNKKSASNSNVATSNNSGVATTSNSNLVTPNNSPKIPEFVVCKIEKESVDDSSENLRIDVPLQSNSSSPKEFESFQKPDSKHNQTGQFKCSCGECFEALPLFLQHNFKCLNSKHKVKVELTTSRKRNSINITSSCFEEPVNKRSEYNCPNCHRKFRTSSTLYQHECQKATGNSSISDNYQSDKNKIEITLAPVEATIPAKHENVENVMPISRNVPIFTCHCLLEFTDYTQFFKHSNQCGKQNELDSSLSSYSSKSSPLKVLPNSVGKFECKDCPKSFTSILSLRQHRDGMHRPLPKFVCKQCGKGYRWCTSFHYHKKQCLANC